MFRNSKNVLAAGLALLSVVLFQTFFSAPLCAAQTLTSAVEGKCGINTLDVPHEGIGMARLAIDGSTNDDFGLGPSIQLTPSSDKYPTFAIYAGAYDNSGIRFDNYFDWTKTGAERQRGSWAGKCARISKYLNQLLFSYASSSGPGALIAWNHAMTIDLSNGAVTMNNLPTTQTALTAIHADTNGKLYKFVPPSSIRYKENVRDVKVEDTDWLYALRPVRFDFKDRSLGTDQCGLIAEEVASINPKIVYFKTVEGDSKEDAEPGGQAGQAASGQPATATSVPEGVNYDKLIVPMLAEIQRLKKRIEVLEGQQEASAKNE